MSNRLSNFFGRKTYIPKLIRVRATLTKWTFLALQLCQIAQPWTRGRFRPCWTGLHLAICTNVCQWSESLVDFNSVSKNCPEVQATKPDLLTWCFKYHPNHDTLLYIIVHLQSSIHWSRKIISSPYYGLLLRDTPSQWQRDRNVYKHKLGWYWMDTTYEIENLIEQSLKGGRVVDWKELGTTCSTGKL